MDWFFEDFLNVEMGYYDDVCATIAHGESINGVMFEAQLFDDGEFLIGEGPFASLDDAKRWCETVAPQFAVGIAA